MNFTGPWSSYLSDGFSGARSGGRPIDMRKLYTSPGFPLPIDEIMLDLRVDGDDERTTIERLSRAAAAFLEKRTAIAVVPGVYEAKFDAWDLCRPWEFMRSPFRQLIEVACLDGNSSPPTWAAQDLDKFFVDERSKSFFVLPLSGVSLPPVWAPMSGIRVRFTAGYDVELSSGVDQDTGELPAMLDDDRELPIADDMRTAVMMLTAHFYENRELFAADKIAQVEMSAGSLLASNRMFW